MIKFGEVRVSQKAKDNVNSVLNSHHITQGVMTEKFEKQWSKLFGYKDSVAVSSGTDACINACLALYDIAFKPCIRNKAEVIVPALSYIATSNAVRAAGLVPKFVDVDVHTLNINPDKIEEAITENTVAIMCVHTMGKMCDMYKIAAIARKHDLVVIEDSAEAHGAMYYGVYPGQIGHMSTFSFYAAHLICSGEGGMVSTMHPEVAEILRSTRSHGRPNGSLYFDHVRTGLNSKMNDLEAAVGLAGVDVFWETFKARHLNMSHLNSRLMEGQFFGFYNLSLEDHGCINCPHGVSLTCATEEIKNVITTALDSNNIQWKRNFGSIPTQQKAFADMGYKLGEFPAAEHIGNCGIHVGCHQYLSFDDINLMVNTILGCLNTNMLPKAEESNKNQ